jgi:hypothetical protein
MRINVKIAILQSRFRQYELAHALGISEYRLSRYVHGREQLRPEQEAKLAALLNLNRETADAVSAGDQEGRSR